MINKNSTTEFIQAEDNKPSPDVWQLSPLDQVCLHMVIRGTWLFAGQLDVDDLKEGLKKLLAYYPHLAGRMKEASGITLTNDGVPFTVVDKLDWRLGELDQRNASTFITTMKIPLAAR